MKKKIITALALLVAAAALVVVSVLGTMAYLTSSSAVSNTFTVGNVGIQMFESKVDSDGKKIADDSNINGSMKDSDGNSYHLLPGTTYDKDPTIYVNANSDESYLFVKVRNNIVNIEAQGNTIADQLAAHGWQFYKATPTGDVYIYTGVGDNNAELTGADLTDIKAQNRAAKPVGGTNQVQEIDLFDTFTIATNANVSLYGGAKVTLTAFAIQISGFADDEDMTAEGAKSAVDKAWDAIVETYPYENGATVSE